MSVQLQPDPRPYEPEGIPFAEYSQASSPGIFLHWECGDRRRRPFKYRVLRSLGLDGDYQPITDVRYPFNEYIDKKGSPRHYYRIQELDESDNVIGEDAPILGEELLIVASLAFHIKDFLAVPLYDEELIISRGRTEGRVAFGNWNTWKTPEVRISGGKDGDAYTTLGTRVEDAITTTLVGGEENYPDGLRVAFDYQGRVLFLNAAGDPQPLDQGDRVLVSYNARLFSGSEMNDALRMSLSTINAQPIACQYPTLQSVPQRWDSGLIAGAAYYLIRSLLVGLNQRERRLLLMDPDTGAFDSIASLREISKQYDDDFKEFLKVVPLQRYARISAVVQPEYQMPGSRSRYFRDLWVSGPEG